MADTSDPHDGRSRDPRERDERPSEGRGPSLPPVSAVPLFPLPNVVLFPRAVLPLHIFEERYKAMTADAMDGDRQVAMALLKPGWEKNYYCKPAIEPVVCVGTIVSCEQLADGKYNFLLQGQTRARIVRELKGSEGAECGSAGKPYRLAVLEPLPEQRVLEIDFDLERRRFTELFEHGPLAGTGIGRQFRTLLAGPLPTAYLADLVAFNFLDDVALKQSLLADTDVRRRVARTLAALEAARPESPFQLASHRCDHDPDAN